MRTVLRGGKPLIVKDLRAHLRRDVGLEEFKYWTALVGRRFARCVALCTLCCCCRTTALWRS